MAVAFTDVRAKRCARCGSEYLPGRGPGGGMCSDRCWVASRGRQLTQGEVLSRALQAQGDRRERRVLGAARVNRLLADAALANDVKRYRQDRRETRELIGRLQRPGSARRAVYDPGHTGPGCAVCAEARRMEAQRAGAAGAEITRVTDGFGGMGQLGTLYGEAVR
jgi:hypothetical protein